MILRLIFPLFLIDLIDLIFSDYEYLPWEDRPNIPLIVNSFLKSFYIIEKISLAIFYYTFSKIYNK